MDSRNTLMNKSNSLIYTHYGSLHFDKSLCVSVRNMDRHPKPADGTGLWASRENDTDGWEAWCRKTTTKPMNLICISASRYPMRISLRSRSRLGL